jgi:hypothetical protein
MWGPWIDHCGTHRPVEKGQLVHVFAEFPDGDTAEKKFVVTKDSFAWYSFNYGRDYGRGYGPCGRITRYRVWKEPDKEVETSKICELETV